MFTINKFPNRSYSRPKVNSTLRTISWSYLQIQEFGVTEARDLRPNGSNIPVTEEIKKEYVKLVCQMRMTGAIRKQLNAFLEGFYDIIPKRLISIFNEQELELLISGLPTVDIDDLKNNSEYHKYQPNSLQVGDIYIMKGTIVRSFIIHLYMENTLSYQTNGKRCIDVRP